MAEASRSAGTGIFLLKDDLLGDGKAASAVFGGPAGARPAAGGERTLPVAPQLGQNIAFSGMAAMAQRREAAGQVSTHPVGDLFSERLVAHATSLAIT